MSAARPADILRRLDPPGTPDADLLARFAAGSDAGAFAELVRRHGPLVLGVCRRVTGHAQDAEDAFQATFLVLAQKAGSLRNAALLGNWLYGVAYRVAWRARRAARRRRRWEVAMPAPPESPAPAASPAAPELLPLLDEELAALPAHYRDAIVLCDLRGASRADAASALGVAEGTLSSRLANGRKRLADRLARRGVALSIAALPLVPSAASAASVPHELLQKTCSLAADCAAGAAVPAALARLTEGGFAVRKLSVFVVTLGAVIAGAVAASQPREAPPMVPPKPPAVAQKAAPDAPPQPKATDGKAVEFATAPKLRYFTEFDFSTVRMFAWNVTGTHLALDGWEKERKRRTELFLLHADRKGVRGLGHLGQSEELAAVAPDGRGAITALREYDLISGRHELRNRQPVEPPATVELDLPESHGYAFAADGKSFRTVAYHRGAGGSLTKLEVLEVDATTGKSAKSLLKLDYGRYAFSANGKRLAVLNDDATKVTAYDVDKGAKVSEHTFDAKAVSGAPPPPTENQAFVILSPDGKRLVVSRGVAWTAVLNADTGERLPALEGTDTARVFPDTHAFTGDGRLLAAVYTPYKVTTRKAPAGKDQTSWSADGSVLSVWDTTTGKALKSWPKADGVRVAFNPARPLLAVLEPNGEANTRVGFWDFVADAAKK